MIAGRRIRRDELAETRVFDFDKTLMSEHWWNKHKDASIEAINPEPKDFVHKNISKVFNDLMSRGVNIAVASFGRTDVIKKAIDSLNLPKHLSDKIYITTPP